MAGPPGIEARITDAMEVLFPGAARGADLFIAEALFFEKKIRYHLDFQTLIAHRERLECRRLVLTHMNDDMPGRLGRLGVEADDDGRVFVV